MALPWGASKRDPRVGSKSIYKHCPGVFHDNVTVVRRGGYYFARSLQTLNKHGHPCMVTQAQQCEADQVKSVLSSDLIRVSFIKSQREIASHDRTRQTGQHVKIDPNK